MFKSKRRPVIIPQLEHSRLAGTLTLLWGNEHFEKPRIEPHSWLEGVTFHDRGYGPLDTFAIGEMAEDQWLNLMRASFSLSQNDPTADLIVKLHVAYFQRIDRITNFLDKIAFDFSFEQPATGEVAIFPKDDDVTVQLQYAIGGQDISIHPWPFSVSRYEGFILGYNADGYPLRIEPVVIPYLIMPSGGTP